MIKAEYQYAGDITHRGKLFACGRAGSPSLVLLTLAYILPFQAPLRIHDPVGHSIVPLRGLTNQGVRREEISPE